MTSQARCTYRVQLRPGWGFRDAAAIAGYLSRLGVSHLYTSPYLAAAAGSSHGYDVVDHTRVNPELGGDDGHAALRAALRENGLAQLVDVVPNHMAIARRENLWWWDVLENGRSSRYASYFDVDWDPPERKLRDTVLLPVLDDHYGRVLEDGRLTVEREGGRFLLRYGESRFPLSPRSADGLLAAAGLRDLAAEAATLPLSNADDEASVADRHARKERLAAEIERRATDAAVAAALDRQVAGINADPDALDGLLARQNYRLAYWRVASQELAYRRFFDINDLVGLRVEREHVFDATHGLVLAWARAGEIDGIRVDHPDGLREPEAYFARLRSAAPAVWLLGEKILHPAEELPGDWPVDGTTGYDFAALAGGLFVDPRSEDRLTDLYAEISGESRPYSEVLYQAKHDVMSDTLAADLERLTVFFVRICEERRRFRDYTRAQLRDALRETVACFPVYRSYVRAEAAIVSEWDRRAICEAVDRARLRRPDLDPELFDLLRDIWLLRITGPNESGLVMRLQQYTAPVMAKGAEDTAFYRYSRLVALNEVGGDPGIFGTTLERFHEHNVRIAERWPRTLLATSTHDTKRSADVRARLALLSQDPSAWTAAVRRWHALAAPHREGDLPDGEMEYLLYQTLVGAYPVSAARAQAYLEKASREAKRFTSWSRPDTGYERALRGFVAGVMSDGQLYGEVSAFARSLVIPGWILSLALTLLKMSAPGVPDLYQGDELWDLSLVDPDNRRDVDFGMRERLLAEATGATAGAALARPAEGLPKLFLIRRALELRSRRPAAFEGGYEPLLATGRRDGEVVAYARGGEVVVVAPRFVLGRGAWQDTRVPLPPGTWRDVLTGASVEGGPASAATLLAGFPVALLERE